MKRGQFDSSCRATSRLLSIALVHDRSHDQRINAPIQTKRDDMRLLLCRVRTGFGIGSAADMVKEGSRPSSLHEHCNGSILSMDVASQQRLLMVCGPFNM